MSARSDRIAQMPIALDQQETNVAFGLAIDIDIWYTIKCRAQLIQDLLLYTITIIDTAE